MVIFAFVLLFLVLFLTVVLPPLFIKGLDFWGWFIGCVVVAFILGGGVYGIYQEVLHPECQQDAVKP